MHTMLGWFSGMCVCLSHCIYRGFASRPGHIKDHHKNSTNCLLAWHVCVRVGDWQCSPTPSWPKTAIHPSHRLGKDTFKSQRSYHHGFVAMTFPLIWAVFSMIIYFWLIGCVLRPINSFYMTYASIGNKSVSKSIGIYRIITFLFKICLHQREIKKIFSWLHFRGNVHACSFYRRVLNVPFPRQWEEWLTVLNQNYATVKRPSIVYGTVYGEMH